MWMAKEGPIFYESTFNTLNFFTHILIDNTKGCRDKKKKTNKKQKNKKPFYLIYGHVS